MTDVQRSALPMTPAQAIELARLVEEHDPDMVVLPLRRPLGDPLPVTFLSEPTDARWVIDTDGVSWPGRSAWRAA